MFGPEDPEASTGTGKATTISSFINLTNTIIGAGMLSIPKAVNDMGLVVGMTLLVLCALGGAFGLSLLAECSRRVGKEKTSYNLVATEYLGPCATVGVDIAVALKCFGVGVAYLVVVGDLMPDAMDGLGAKDSPWNQRRFWIGIAMAMIVPLSMLKKIDSLRFTSAISICTAFYLIGVLVYFTATLGTTEAQGSIKYVQKLDSDFLSGLPVMVFAFTCHQNIFAIHSELKRNTRARTLRVIIMSVLTCALLYSIVAVCGYVTYRANAESNFINNLPKDLATVNIGRIVISLNVTLSFALQSHPARECLNNLVVYFSGLEENAGQQRAVYQEISLPSPTHETVPMVDQEQAKASLAGREGSGCMHWLLVTRRTQWYWFLSLFICGASFAVAWLLDDLGIVFGLVGGTGSTALCYIFPGLLYLRSEQILTDRDGLERPWDSRRVGAAVLLIIGILMVGVANWATIDSQGKSTDEVPDETLKNALHTAIRIKLG